MDHSPCREVDLSCAGFAGGLPTYEGGKTKKGRRLLPLTRFLAASPSHDLAIAQMLSASLEFSFGELLALHGASRSSASIKRVKRKKSVPIRGCRKCFCFTSQHLVVCFRNPDLRVIAPYIQLCFCFDCLVLVFLRSRFMVRYPPQGQQPSIRATARS